VNFDSRLLTSSNTMVNRATLKAGLSQLFSIEAQVALFYFSGHGFLNDLGGYLVTQDATQFDEGVAMAEILTMANQSKADQVVVILDCCHSGAFGSVSSIKEDTSLLQKGVSILCASGHAEAAVETSGHGLFTGLLLDALSDRQIYFTGEMRMRA
jgi:uncharacterized caspase-like protein